MELHSGGYRAQGIGASRENACIYEKSRQDRQSLQTDPVGHNDDFDPYNSDLNLYSYGGDNPIDLDDPFGLASQPNDTPQANTCSRVGDVSCGGDYAANATEAQALEGRSGGGSGRHDTTLGPMRNPLACARTGNFGCGSTPAQDQVYSDAMCGNGSGAACAAGAALPVAIAACVVGCEDVAAAATRSAGDVIGSTRTFISRQAARLSEFVGPRGPLFGRNGGFFNSNDYVRVGWNWKGPSAAGRLVFRIAIGSRRLPFHWHWP